MVPSPLFKAYLKGGALWPQKRGGINIFLLSQLMTNGPKILWPPFVLSTFSSDQVRQVRNAMQALHDHAGIPISVTDETLFKEWSVTKAAVCRSLLFYARRADPRSGGQALEDFANTLFVSEADAFVANLDEQTESNMKRLVLRARDVLVEHADLARLVVLTFYWESQRQAEYQRHRQFYLQASERYGHRRLTEDATGARGHYLATITTLLKTTLIREFPNEFVDWLVWGF
jgi:hypothetical protein